MLTLKGLMKTFFSSVTLIIFAKRSVAKALSCATRFCKSALKTILPVLVKSSCFGSFTTSHDKTKSEIIIRQMIFLIRIFFEPSTKFVSYYKMLSKKETLQKIYFYKKIGT